MRSITLNRFNSILICSILICAVLYYGRIVMIPLSFAIFFAMLTAPVSRRLEARGMNRVFSTLISLLIIMVSLSFIITLVFQQFKMLTDDLPTIKERSAMLIESTENRIGGLLQLSEDQMILLREKVRDGIQSSGSYFKTFFSGTIGLIRDILLVLVWMFLLLYQREKYGNFFLMLVKAEDREQSKVVMQKISKVAQNYLTGRMISVLIFTVTFGAGFLLVGVKGAILLAFIAALLTIIPYVGSIIGGLFPFAVALVTSDSSTAYGALAVVVIVQFFDNYFIEPYVIGGEVHLSGIFTILSLVFGGLVWGPAGMILFIPMLGIAKIVFDNVEELKPYGYLVGDQKKGKSSERMFGWVKRLFKKS